MESVNEFPHPGFYLEELFLPPTLSPQAEPESVEVQKLTAQINKPEARVYIGKAQAEACVTWRTRFSAYD